MAARVEPTPDVDAFDLSADERAQLSAALGEVDVVSVTPLEILGPNTLAAETVVQGGDGRLHTSLSIFRRASVGPWRLAVRFSRPALGSLEHAVRRYREREVVRRRAWRRCERQREARRNRELAGPADGR